MKRIFQKSPLTLLFLIVIWMVYATRIVIESQFGWLTVESIFVVKYANLTYVWTWFTAPFGHVNLAHLIFNSIFALYIIPETEQTFGRKLVVASFVLGGALTALFGTVLMAGVRYPFLTEWASASGMGTSMGLFVLLGMLLARYWTNQTTTRGLRRLELQNATLFLLFLAVSIAGVAFDV
jgi:membrane associated rhomboid family serine protease